MRRKDREVTEKTALEEIIKSCKVCRIAMLSDGKPYIVPMNFGYTWNEELVFFFHGALEGKKIDAMLENAQVCIEMDCGHALTEAEIACGYGYKFASVVAEGTVSFLEEQEEKENALIYLMQHQTGKMNWEFEAEMLQRVSVFAVKVNKITGKKRG